MPREHISMCGHCLTCTFNGLRQVRLLIEPSGSTNSLIVHAALRSHLTLFAALALFTSVLEANIMCNAEMRSLGFLGLGDFDGICF